MLAKTGEIRNDDSESMLAIPYPDSVATAVFDCASYPSAPAPHSAPRHLEMQPPVPVIFRSEDTNELTCLQISASPASSKETEQGNAHTEPSSSVAEREARRMVVLEVGWWASHGTRQPLRDREGVGREARRRTVPGQLRGLVAGPTPRTRTPPPPPPPPPPGCQEGEGPSSKTLHTSLHIGSNGAA